MTDEEIVLKIRNTVAELNGCLKLASQSAIICELDIDSQSIQCVGNALVRQMRIGVEIGKAL